MTKQELRMRCRSLIAALPAERKAVYDRIIGQLILEHARSQRYDYVGLYYPLQHEPDIQPLFSIVERIALPAYHNQEPCFRLWDGQRSSLEAWRGFMQPLKAAPVVYPQLIFVPCLGFTAEGYRLGHGGGFYDRWLAQNPATEALGVGYCEQMIHDFSPDNHDIKLKLILTPH